MCMCVCARFARRDGLSAGVKAKFKRSRRRDARGRLHLKKRVSVCQKLRKRQNQNSCELDQTAGGGDRVESEVRGAAL